MREPHDSQTHYLEQSTTQSITPVIARSTGDGENNKAHHLDRAHAGIEVSAAIQETEHCMRAKAASLLELIEQQQQLWI
jgi:hypothetical protein